MNRLPATVIVLETEGEISLVQVDAAGVRLTALVLESAASAAWLAPGSPVTALFKESEVSLALPPVSPLSIRNRIPCTVRAVAEGALLSHLTLAWAGGELEALITTRAARELGLAPGIKAEALIKSTEVSLAEGHAGP